MSESKKKFNLLIIGGGPAGYTAGIYAARAGLKTAVMEKLAPGGQMALTDHIDNYPGAEPGIDGVTLGEQMRKNAEYAGAESIFDEVTGVQLDGPVKTIHTANDSYQSDTVIIAAGAEPRPLGVPNEDHWIGRGLSYCAVCDGMFFRGKTVAVIGGGNTAVSDALMLSGICEHVYLIHRRDQFRADQVLTKKLEHTENITVLRSSILTAIEGNDRISGLRVQSKETGNEQSILCDGVFAAIGRIPTSTLFKEHTATDEAGYILTDGTMETNIPGVFAAGDIRAKSFRQIITAAADGAIAAHSAEIYLQKR